MIKHLIRFLVVAASFFALSASAQSLSFVKYTRLIFDGSQKAISFPIQNDTNAYYLATGRVRKVQENQPGDLTPDFMVLPEVLLLKPGEHQALRVVRVGGQYPSDRESVFFVSGVFVPEKQSETNASLNVALEVNVKMFFRPDSLLKKGAIKHVAEQLIFALGPKELRVQNPTPYYATFSSLSVNEKALNHEQLTMMVPPFGESRYSIKEIGSAKNGVINWSLIDELGNDTATLVKEVRVEK